jgi:hypothetical protein
MRKVPFEFLSRYVGNIFAARLGGGRNKKLVRTMTAGLYLTVKCNFRCTYCDGGSGNMYRDIPDHRLDTAETLRVLEIMRECSPGLDITGGEVKLIDLHARLDRLHEPGGRRHGGVALPAPPARRRRPAPQAAGRGRAADVGRLHGVPQDTLAAAGRDAPAPRRGAARKRLHLDAHG